MNGTPQRVEIFAPFGAALELMQKILFRPFDVKKWFVIGFAAFLSHLAGGGANFGGNWGRHMPTDWKTSVHSATSDMSDSVHHFPLWVIPVGIIAALIILAIVAVFLWLGSRGKFIFTDCIVRNRGAIEEPWREYRREGNSLFLFSIVIALIFLAVILVFGSIVFLPAILQGDNFTAGVSFIIGGISFVLLILIMVFAWALISQFMVPIMYRRRCTASEAFRTTLSLITARFGLFVLYFLFVIVLGLATAMIACIATCITCCITAIPYVGTVILLPLYVTLAAYPLLFVRQFGTDFDVWAAVTPPVTSEPPIQPPPTIPPEPPPLPA
jgi:hypothetical protein